jgi:hypothetical protein
MRHAVRNSWLFAAFALAALVALGGCQNPLDPISKSDKIQGLSYVDFAPTWERWDADPQFDGLSIGMDYFNEFGDSLAFHDKSHNVVIEMWTQKNTGTTEKPFKVKDTMFFTRTIDYSNSDDDIRIPIEAYYADIPRSLFTDPLTGLELTEVKAMMVVRVFPPQEFPRPELLVAQADVTIFKPETAEDVPNL